MIILAAKRFSCKKMRGTNKRWLSEAVQIMFKAQDSHRRKGEAWIPAFAGMERRGRNGREKQEWLGKAGMVRKTARWI
jgi:hypothetical protein